MSSYRPRSRRPVLQTAAPRTTEQSSSATTRRLPPWAAVTKAFDEEGVNYESIWKQDVLEGIVFTFPETEEVWKRFGNCLGCDHTYSTNALNFSLMVVTAMTNINTVANVAFALVREKTTACSTTLVQGVERFLERLGAAMLHVVITDQDEQQRDALFEVWPDVQQHLPRTTSLYPMILNVW